MTRPKRVLLVEDDDLHCKLYEAWLRFGNFEPVIIKDPRGVLLKADAIKPDVIVLDLLLPHVSGIEVVRQLRGATTTGTTPIAILTVCDRQEDRDACEAAGSDAYLVKPVSSGTFLATIERLAHGGADR